VLASDGINPLTGERLLHSKVVQTVKSIMLTCGMYDGSGRFAVEVGVPSKSGVGGGILSVVDKRMGIGIFGPALDTKGNSIAGQHVLRELSSKMRLHMFADHVPEY
jgi:glutaminase